MLCTRCHGASRINRSSIAYVGGINSDSTGAGNKIWIYDVNCPNPQLAFTHLSINCGYFLSLST